MVRNSFIQFHTLPENRNVKFSDNFETWEMLAGENVNGNVF
jgi:hypothetical protein